MQKVNFAYVLRYIYLYFEASAFLFCILRHYSFTKLRFEEPICTQTVP